MAARAELAVRHSIAPRVLDNTLPMSTITSTARFSVRVAPPSIMQQQKGLLLDSVKHIGVNDGTSSTGPILATFVWKDRGARVQLAGSFDDWRKHDMTYVPGVSYFLLVAELPPGEYFYRFIVDGRWTVAQDDHNLREDPFGELSHFLVINSETLKSATPNRFSTAAISRVQLPKSQHENVSSTNKSLTNSDHNDNFHDESVNSEEEQEEDNPAQSDSTVSKHVSNQSAPGDEQRVPRQRGEEYINDYDEDPCGEYDLQADVFEAMVDVKEAFSESESRALLVSHTDQQSVQANSRRRRNPTRKLFRMVFARLFGKEPSANSSRDMLDAENDEQSSRTRGQKPVIGFYGRRGYSGLKPISDDVLRMRGIPVDANDRRKKRLRVWFPNERTFPDSSNNNGRKMDPEESARYLDASTTALRFNLAEENANNRQLLGKTLFAQGKYDAALALFSLSVKIREDNGLRNAKTTAIAHTDVASAFIHLNDMKNAEKHLKTALSIFDRGTFSGGKPQLGDVHCFLGVVLDMKGSLRMAEISYRTALSLYEEAGAIQGNLNYTTALQNLKDNVRRQKENPHDDNGDMSDINTISTNETLQYSGSDASMQRIDASASVLSISSPGAPNNITGIRNAFERRAEKENIASELNAARTRHLNAQKQNAGKSAGLTPQTLSTIGSFPDSDSSSLCNSRLLDPSALANAPVALSSKAPLPPALEECRKTAERTHDEDTAKNGTSHGGRRRSSRPATWKALADVARASMPTTPLEHDGKDDGNDDDSEAAAALGSYEEMSREWQRDGRKLLIGGNYSEAIDMYTLAIYTRKRHGPWFSKANAETHVEYARALFATNDVKAASEALRDAIAILEKLNDTKLLPVLGDVWGNLGCALDRLGGHALDAESAHCAGLVAYGKLGMSKNDPKWTKAWRNLCINIKAQGSKAKSIDEVWHSIELQIQGKAAMTRVASVKIHF